MNGGTADGQTPWLRRVSRRHHPAFLSAPLPKIAHVDRLVKREGDHDEEEALLIIDMLNDFVLPGDPLEVPETRNVIKNIRREIDAPIPLEDR